MIRVPDRLRKRLRRLVRPAWLGTLRRTRPLSEHWGFDRGTPIDRHYIETFLAEHRDDIRGRVLEIKDSRYTDRFGTGVVERAVLDVDPANPLATIAADLAAADAAPSDRFDCFVLTQTLQYVYDVRAAAMQAARVLRPGGVLLATLPAVSRVDRELAGTDCWRFTEAPARRLFDEAFGPGQATVRSYGNVLTAVAFLTGMAREELSRRELEAHDDAYPLLIAVRAVKAGGPGA